jgi:hypothetical protein
MQPKLEHSNSLLHNIGLAYTAAILKQLCIVHATAQHNAAACREFS